MDRFGQRVYSVAYHFTLKREDAEELSQEIFLKIFENLHRYDGSFPLVAWIVSLSRNLCIDRYRRRKREKSFRFVSDDAVAPLLQSADDPAAEAIKKERTKLLFSALGRDSRGPRRDPGSARSRRPRLRRDRQGARRFRTGRSSRGSSAPAPRWLARSASATRPGHGARWPALAGRRGGRSYELPRARAPLRRRRREAEFAARTRGLRGLRRARRRDRGRRRARGGPPPPGLSPALRESLFAIPAHDRVLRAAPELLARGRSGRDEISAADRARLADPPLAMRRLHRGRATSSELARAHRARAAAVARDPRARGREAGEAPAGRGWRWLLDPRGAIPSRTPRRSSSCSSGLNPADLARKAGTARLEQTRARRRPGRRATRSSTGSAPSRSGRSARSRP